MTPISIMTIDTFLKFLSSHLGLYLKIPERAFIYINKDKSNYNEINSEGFTDLPFNHNSKCK